MTTEDTKNIKGFPKYKQAKSHIEAVERYGNVYASLLGTIPDLTSNAVAEERQNNRKILLKILSNMRYLGNYCLFYFLWTLISC